MINMNIFGGKKNNSKITAKHSFYRPYALDVDALGDVDAFPLLVKVDVIEPDLGHVHNRTEFFHCWKQASQAIFGVWLGFETTAGTT